MDLRIFALICVVLGGMGQGVVVPNLPILLKESQHIALDSGFSATIMYLGIFFSTFQYGKLADRGKVHLLLTLGLLVYAISLIFLGIIHSIYAIFLVRFFEGLAISAVFVAADFILARMSKLEERGRWLSYYGVALSVGLILGPLLVLILARITHFVFAPLLIVAAAACLLAIFSFNKKISSIQNAPPLKQKLNITALSCGSVYGYMEAGLVAVFPVLAITQFHVRVEYCLIFLIICAAIFSILWGELADKIGAKKIIKFLLILLALGPLFLSISPAFMASAHIAYAACVLFGSLAGGLYPVGFNWLIADIPESQYGQASGAFARAYGIGSVLGPTISGITSQEWGASGLFLSFTLLGLISFFSIEFFKIKQRASGANVS